MLDKSVAVILAGGYGTRVKHLLPNLPKPMAPVAGKPFVEWVLRYLKAQGISRAILSTGYLAEIIEEYFSNQPILGMEVSCCRETSPLGTAGGFLNAVSKYSGNPTSAWLCFNGDSLVFADLAPFIAHINHPHVDGSILGVSIADASRYGSLVCDEQENLLSFAEKRPGAGIINGGVYLFRNSLVAQFPKTFPLSFETEVFPTLLANNATLKVHSVDAPFLDIGTPESLAQAEAFIQQNLSQFSK